MAEPQLLIEGTIAAETTGEFNVGREYGVESATIFAKGLAGSEVVAIDILSKDLDSPESTDWLAVYIAGTAQELTATENIGIVASPGRYRVRCSSSAGAIRVGIYRSFM